MIRIKTWLGALAMIGRIKTWLAAFGALAIGLAGAVAFGARYRKSQEDAENAEAYQHGRRRIDAAGEINDSRPNSGVTDWLRKRSGK